MNETSINPISSVRLTEPGVSAKITLPEKIETAIVREPTLSISEKSTKQIENESDQTKSVSNVSIHFEVDDETNQLTIFVVDKQSKRVLRSIPTSELSKLQAGELLKLTA
jgi:uncharacterized FlaG/YvyC family protein